MLEVVEDVYVYLVERSVFFDELAEGVFKIVALGEFEDRLSNLLAEPYDSLADELRSPVAVAYEPWSAHASEEGSGSLINEDGCVVMELEI